MVSTSINQKSSIKIINPFWMAPLAALIVVLAVQSLAHLSQRTPAASAAQDFSMGVQAGHSATIPFKTQNGLTINGATPQTGEIPHLVLYRNGQLTAPEERTIVFTVENYELPAAGAIFSVSVETQHGDPDLGGGETHRIPVVQHTQTIPNETGVAQENASLRLAHEFGAWVENTAGRIRIPTPTDYFKVVMQLRAADQPEAELLYSASQDYAFLMENQLVQPLPELKEVTNGAAPDNLVVYFTDMFPLQSNPYDAATRLPRAAVRDYYQNELVPGLVEAVRQQSNDWVFPWHPTWKNYRADESNDQLSVAFTQSGTWYHGSAPSNAHAGITINVEGSERADYNNLTSWILSAFHHELFHNVQRDLNQAGGGSGDVDGEKEAWDFIAEGTAVMASSVGRPEVEFAQPNGKGAYLSEANIFLAGDGIYSDDLNTSYAEMRPYHAALYWRFVYERSSGLANGAEDIALGMQVIQQTLRTIYGQDRPDLSDPELVRDLPTVMDKVFSLTPNSPFRSFEDSLVQFSRSVYGLRLAEGRYAAGGSSTGYGFYDPNKVYHEPPVAEAAYDGSEQSIAGEIPSSYGMDFIEIGLDTAPGGDGVRIEFSPATASAARFHVEVWQLGDEAGRQQKIAEVSGEADPEGTVIFSAPAHELANASRLAVIVTRLDADEKVDPLGAYTLNLTAEAGDAPNQPSMD